MLKKIGSIVVALYTALCGGCSDKAEPTSNLKSAASIETHLKEKTLDNTISFNHGSSSLIYNYTDWQQKVAHFKKQTLDGYVDFALPFNNNHLYLECSITDPKEDRRAYVTIDAITKKATWSLDKDPNANKYRIIE